MLINTPVHVEPPDTTGGAGITLNLATDTKDPHPALDADGPMTVELWSDFKRHDVGAALADSKSFNQIAANQWDGAWVPACSCGTRSVGLSIHVNPRQRARAPTIAGDRLPDPCPIRPGAAGGAGPAPRGPRSWPLRDT